jgi:hypothetical protein
VNSSAWTVTAPLNRSAPSLDGGRRLPQTSGSCSYSASRELEHDSTGIPLRARGKNGGVIGCAMANRANKIAYALVRDQTGYDPDRWA